jgi:predicted NAD/FAD-binding protein
MMEFPALSFFNFFNNHKLLGITGQPVWKTVVGGSHSYVKAIRATLQKDVIVNSPVKSIARKKGAVKISAGRKQESFDAVIVATHADEALKLLSDPTADEKRLLGAWKYQKNHTVLHTDESLMPTNKNARASWNFIRNASQRKDAPLTLTYHMNRLQGLTTVHQYFVTLNSARPIPKEKIIVSMDYYHPTYTFESMNTQKELHTLNGINGTFFCGSYFGYGFHEDAVRSGTEVAKMLGCEL